MANTTPDIKLTVGVKRTVSYEQMKDDIKSIVTRLDKTPPRIKFGANQTASYAQIRSDIENIITKMNANPPKIKVGLQLDDTKLNAAIETLKASIGKAENDLMSKHFTATRKQRATNSKSTSASTSANKSAWIGNAENAVYSFQRRIGNQLDSWSAAKGSEAYKKLEGVLKESKKLGKELHTLDQSKYKERFRGIVVGANEATDTLKKAGLATKSWSDKMGSLSQKFATWLTVSQLITTAYHALRKMYTSVVEIDTAMTELKKVTNETAAEYDRFLDRASVRAKKYGATLSDVVRSTADFARLGYNIKDAEKISDAAIVYKNVGDGISDINQATESIISTMQAFGVEANSVMSIVDRFNIVGNNFAITSGGIGDALLNSASALKAAGNTLDESIALITAANEVVQSPEKVGKLIAQQYRNVLKEGRYIGQRPEMVKTEERFCSIHFTKLGKS